MWIPQILSSSVEFRARSEIPQTLFSSVEFLGADEIPQIPLQSVEVLGADEIPQIPLQSVEFGVVAGSGGSVLGSRQRPRVRGAQGPTANQFPQIGSGFWGSQGLQGKGGNCLSKSRFPASAAFNG